jgi:iron complex transport system permease protein
MVATSVRAPARVTTRTAVLVIAAGALLAAVALSLTVGSKTLPLGAVIDALTAPDGGEASVIVRSMRLPRTAVGVLVGAALAMAGVLLQALTRNPLADPRILGLSAGGSLGVVVATAVFGITTLLGYVWFALAGVAVAGLCAYAVAARTRDGASPVTLALAGAALDASFGAVVVAVLAIDAHTFEEYRMWVVGSLAGRGTAIALQMLPLVLAGAVLAATVARGLDALALGDDVARGLGHRVGLVRLAGAVATVLLAGAAVAAAGPVAFVGLAVPHLARALVGPGLRWLLPAAALLGPVLLLAADVVGRVIAPPGEVPAGIVTALVGAPLLVALVRRARLAAT